MNTPRQKQDIAPTVQASVQPRTEQKQPAQKKHPAIQAAVRPQTVPAQRMVVPQQRTAAPEAQGRPERLIAILEKTAVLYRQLHDHAKARRVALRSADYAGFSKLDEPERRVVDQIAELDRERLAEARAIAVRLGLPPDASLGAIGERLPPAVGGRLIQLREELRTLIVDVRRETSVVRQAAERISAHIAGIVQTVHSALAQASIYSSGGQIATGGGGMISSLDIRS